MSVIPQSSATQGQTLGWSSRGSLIHTGLRRTEFFRTAAFSASFPMNQCEYYPPRVLVSTAPAGYTVPTARRPVCTQSSRICRAISWIRPVSTDSLAGEKPFGSSKLKRLRSNAYDSSLLCHTSMTKRLRIDQNSAYTRPARSRMYICHALLQSCKFAEPRPRSGAAAVYLRVPLGPNRYE